MRGAVTVSRMVSIVLPPIALLVGLPCGWHFCPRRPGCRCGCGSSSAAGAADRYPRQDSIAVENAEVTAWRVSF